MKNRRNLFERFMKHIKYPSKDDDIDCWIWTGGKTKFGYGMMRDETGKKSPAHRIAFRLFVFDFRKDLNVLHMCDNPSCVNPNHLFLGTRSDNMRDMWNKRRHPIDNMGRPSSTMVGEKNIKAKLTEEDVLKIRDLYKEGKRQKELSEMYNINLPAIWKIVHNKTWKHL